MSVAVKNERPNIFSYHDSRLFLKDWFAFRKATESKFSLRSLSQEAGFSSNGYLSKVVSGHKALTSKALTKISAFLKLTHEELSYLELLRSVSETKHTDGRERALKRLQSFSKFQKMGERETEVYLYLTQWYYVAIREMTNLADFKADPEWIKKRLRNEVTTEQIREALAFLKKYEYLAEDETGRLRLKERHLQCLDGVYRIALAKFFAEMLELGKRALENTPRGQRYLRGYTVSIKKGQMKRIREILDEAHDAVHNSFNASQEDSDETYQITLMAVPLTKSSNEESAIELVSSESEGDGKKK